MTLEDFPRRVDDTPARCGERRRRQRTRRIAELYRSPEDVIALASVGAGIALSERDEGLVFEHALAG
jgi:hypothetical protein